MEAPVEGDSRQKRELVILKKSDQNQLETTTTMAKTFHQFLDLPKELRLKIWEQAMIEARPSRRIIIDESRVVPFKQLISPLLLVNYESRTCAKAFYNVKLDIYAVPPVTQTQVEHLDKQKLWNGIKGSERAVDGNIHAYSDEWLENYFEAKRLDCEHADEPDYDTDAKNDDIDDIDRWEKEYTIDLEEHWSDFVRDELLVLGEDSIRRAEASGPTTGAFYISPEHDVFITDCDCRMHFAIDSASRILGADFPSIQAISCRHISSELSAATCQRVSTLVILRIHHSPFILRNREEAHCVFADYKAIQLGGGKNGYHREFEHGWCRNEWEWCCFKYRRTWKKKVFPNVQAHFVLWNSDYGEMPRDFLTKLTRMNDAELDAELSKHLELWDKDEFRRRGEVMKRGMRRVKAAYGTGKADWVRDLMAHWDINN